MKRLLGIVVLFAAMTSVAQESPGLEKLRKTVKFGRSSLEKVAAAKSIGILGNDGKEAAPELCLALLDLSPSVRTAAIEALEKVRPDLYQHLVVIMTDQDIYNHVVEINKLGLLGEVASPVIPLLLARIKGELSIPLRYVYQKNNIKVQLPVYIVYDDNYRESVAGICFTAIERIAPDDADTLKLLIILAGPTTRQVGDRTAALRAVGKIAEAKTDQRKKLLPTLVSGLSVKDQSCVLTSIEALGRLGKEGKDAIPVLKKMKLSSVEAVRKAANEAADRLEAAE